MGQIDLLSQWLPVAAQGSDTPPVTLVNITRSPPPPVFVSVASKEFNNTVSLLFATHAGRSISVAAKELKGMVAIDGRIAGGAQKQMGCESWFAQASEMKDE